MNISELVAIPKEDLISTNFFEMPPNTFANLDLIFKLDRRDDYFFFEKFGQWKEDNIAIPELNFDTLFDEKKWMDFNNPYGV